MSVEECGDANDLFLLVDNREGQDVLDLPPGLIHCLFLSGERQRAFVGSVHGTPEPNGKRKFSVFPQPLSEAKAAHLKCKVLVGRSVHHVADLGGKYVGWREQLIDSGVLRLMYFIKN